MSSFSKNGHGNVHTKDERSTVINISKQTLKRLKNKTQNDDNSDITAIC
jgi:hypothetical protein